MSRTVSDANRPGIAPKSSPPDGDETGGGLHRWGWRDHHGLEMFEDFSMISSYPTLLCHPVSRKKKRPHPKFTAVAVSSPWRRDRLREGQMVEDLRIDEGKKIMDSLPIRPGGLPICIHTPMAVQTGPWLDRLTEPNGQPTIGRSTYQGLGDFLVLTHQIGWNCP